MLKFDPEAFAADSALPLFHAEHDAYREAVRDFVAAVIGDNIDDWEANRDYPRELFRTVGTAGHFGTRFDPRWGGAGPDLVASAVFTEELARCGAAGLVADLRAHADQACRYLDRLGTEAQKRRYLAPSIAGELVGGVGVTTLDDDGGIDGPGLHAVRDADDWVIDGGDLLVLNGSWADYVIVAAAGSDSAQHPEVLLFILDTETAGVERRRHVSGGWRTSHTALLSCTEVRLSDAHRLGRPGGEMSAIGEQLVWERLVIALSSLATAEVSLEQAIAYARERRAFGRPISSFQVWQHRFADLGTDIELARSLTHHALRTYVAEDRGDQVPAGELERSTAMAKLFTDRVAQRTADECVQLHGGAGYLTEYPAQRYWRDTRLGVPSSGSTGAMRGIVATSMGR